MDLTYDALNKNIDTELKPIYLLYGSEQYLIENTVNRIKKKFGEKVLGINYCSLCGCPLKDKLRVEDEHCLNGKW